MDSCVPKIDGYCERILEAGALSCPSSIPCPQASRAQYEPQSPSIAHNELTIGQLQLRIKCNLNRISACNIIPSQFRTVCGEIICKANINKSRYKECSLQFGLCRLSLKSLSMEFLLIHRVRSCEYN